MEVICFLSRRGNSSRRADAARVHVVRGPADGARARVAAAAVGAALRAARAARGQHGSCSPHIYLCRDCC